MKIEDVAKAKEAFVEDGILYGDDARMGVWVSERIGQPMIELPFVAIGVIKDDKIIAAGYYFNHQTTGGWSDLNIAFAMDSGTNVTKDLVQRFLRYPFVQLKVRRLTAEIDFTNIEMQKLAAFVGFKLEGKKRRCGPHGGDVGIFGLIPEECPFLGSN